MTRSAFPPAAAAGQVLLDPMRLADYVNATLCDLTE